MQINAGYIMCMCFTFSVIISFFLLSVLHFSALNNKISDMLL